MRKHVALAAMSLAAMIVAVMPAGAGQSERGQSIAETHLDGVRSDLESGLAAMRGRDWVGARVYLQRAVDRDPQDPDALAAMGETFLRLRDYESAFQYTEAALIVQPDNRRAVATMGEIALAQGNAAEARRRAGQLAEQCPKGCAERTRLDEAIAGRRGNTGGS